MRARSGTRTFSCVIFFRTLPAPTKKIGAAAYRQPRIRASSNERALESLGVPVLIGSRREQTTKCPLSTPSRRENSSTDQFNYIEKARGRVKEEFSYLLGGYWPSPAALPAGAYRCARRSDK